MYACHWRKKYEEICSDTPRICCELDRPLIGITGNFGEKGCELAEGYYMSILRAGGIPLVIPPNVVDVSLLDRLDAIVFSGGGDVNPIVVGEEPIPSLHSINARRDVNELLLAQMASDRQLPILGICRGAQIINLAFGGTIYQDLSTQHPNSSALIKHSQDLERSHASHSVDIDSETMLETIFDSESNKIFVNSFHHQAINKIGKNLRISARAVDGVVEAIESSDKRPIIGVQWHPECLETSVNLFSWLIDEAKIFAKVKNIHDGVVSIDSHCDTPMFFEEGINFNHRDSKIKVDSHKMLEGRLDASCMVAYIPQGELSDEGRQGAYELAKSRIEELKRMIDASPITEQALCRKDILENKRKGKKSILIGIENGYAIGTDIKKLEEFKSMGVVYITLCHNGDNDICGSAKGKGEHGGLTDFGKRVVEEMNRLGIMVDLSHASEQTFFDVMKLSKVPPICSHSSSKAVYDNPRNLSDAQLKEIIKKNSVAQVTFYHGFLSSEPEENVNIDDVMKHLLHMIDVAGIDHIGFGSDFDGDGGVEGLNTAAEFPCLTRQLIKEGFDYESIQKLWGENFLRVMDEVQNYYTNNKYNGNK